MIKTEGDILLYSTTGASMFPFVRWNEYIVVKKVSPKAIRYGDIAVFSYNGRIKFCHRVVKIEEKDGNLWFQTKGDRNSFPDTPVREEMLLGKVIAVKRRLSLIGLPYQGGELLLYKLDCLFIWGKSLAKRTLSKIIFS
jgi:signal peptidase I